MSFTSTSLFPLLFDSLFTSLLTFLFTTSLLLKPLYIAHRHTSSQNSHPDRVQQPALVQVITMQLLVSASLLLLCIPETVLSSRYFHFRGKTISLVSDGEHYGGLINKQFAYDTYFSALASKNLSLTVAFSGTYVEPGQERHTNHSHTKHTKHTKH